MNHFHGSSDLDRRELLKRTILLLGGTSAVWSAPTGAIAAPAALQQRQLALLDEIADTMIPDTDTPGARAAGVPDVLRSMLRDWAASATVTALLQVLSRIDAAARTRFGASFLDVTSVQRNDVLSRFDRERIAAGDKAYMNLKSLILNAYYLSEIGATVELRYLLVPGSWQACLPMSDTRAWAV